MESLAWSGQVPSSQTKVEETGAPHGWQKGAIQKTEAEHKTYIPGQAASDAEKG